MQDTGELQGEIALHGEVITFKCRPTLRGLLNQRDGLHQCFPGGALKLRCEATYIGHTLQRDLVEKGYHCDVVAPTSIRSPRKKQVKTDRIDATQLAQFYASADCPIHTCTLHYQRRQCESQDPDSRNLCMLHARAIP